MAVRTFHESTLESQTLGVPAAAAHCRVSVSEVRRRLRGGAFPGAAKDEHGHWQIPVGDLEAAISGVFGAHRTAVDLSALEVSVRTKPASKRRRAFSGSPASGWSSKMAELQRVARERGDCA